MNEMTIPAHIGPGGVRRLATKAANSGWTDKTFYGDPDCDLSQTFTKGPDHAPITAVIIWKGTGRFESIEKITVKVADYLLFYQQVGNQYELQLAAVNALQFDYDAA